MRKLPFYVCTAAAILAAGTMTGTAYGATAGTYNIPGGRAVVIGGSGLDDLKSVMGQKWIKSESWGYVLRRYH